ncbi:MAG: hypothetical protein ACSLFO_03615 [Acidimicrobiales bacterium]
MTQHPGTPRRERGSVLMLMPAAIVIVLLLGAITVDSAIVYLEQRRAYNVAFDAANDAVGAGLDRDIVRTTGELVYDVGRVQAVAAATVEASEMDRLRLVSAAVEDGAIEVVVEVRVQRLFGQAFGDRSSETVRVVARAGGEVRDP